MFATAFYLKQEVAPGLYAPIRAVPRHFEPAAWRFVLSAVIVAGLTIVLIAWRRRWPSALVAWVCYLVLLAPVSGLVRSGLISPVADRYTYVACVGWALLAGAMGLAGWRRGERRATRARERVVAAVLVGGVLAGWAAMSWSNVQLWRDSKTLWTHAVSVAPEAAEAHTHLGIVFEMQGQLDAAARQYTEAVRIRPDQARGQLYLGLALARQGRLSEAVGPLRRALALNWPTPIPDASLTLGVILLAEGRTADAIRELEVALRFAPRSASAHYNLAVALARQGNTAAARAHYREALELRPDLAAAPTGSGPLGQGVRAPGATSDPAR